MPKILTRIWTSIIEYETPRLVRIHNRKLGLVRRLIQLSIVCYLLVYALWLQKGYQEFTRVESSVTVKIKGVTKSELGNGTNLDQCKSAHFHNGLKNSWKMRSKYLTSIFFWIDKKVSTVYIFYRRIYNSFQPANSHKNSNQIQQQQQIKNANKSQKKSKPSSLASQIRKIFITFILFRSSLHTGLGCCWLRNSSSREWCIFRCDKCHNHAKSNQRW